MISTKTYIATHILTLIAIHSLWIDIFIFYLCLPPPLPPARLITDVPVHLPTSQAACSFECFPKAKHKHIAVHSPIGPDNHRPVRLWAYLIKLVISLNSISLFLLSVQLDAFFTTNYEHIPVSSHIVVHTSRSTCLSTYMFIWCFSSS